MSIRTLWAVAICGALSLSVVAREEEKKEVHIEAKDVPAKVMEAVKKDFPTAKIEEIEKETYPDGTIHYEFELKLADGKEQEVEYNAEGERLEKHEEEHAEHAH